ncbi:MAG: DUF4340 domain-containing protein [Lentisphaerae bacterium]|nr:DUF4340 domain-containing protein [Lentisphaerota bacterium]
MHLRTTFFLLVLTLLLAAFIAIVERSGRESVEPLKPKLRLLEIEAENVSYCSFARDELFVEFLLSDGQWMIQQPVAARADNGKLNHILFVLGKLPRHEIITAPERQSRALSLEDYGLAKPWARVVLGNAQQRYPLAVGALAPLRDALYVRFEESDEVIVTATNLLEIIPRAVADLRDRRLLPGTSAYIQGLEIKRLGGPRIEIAREGAEWIIQKPLVARADAFKVTHLLEQLFNLPIQQFVAEHMAEPAIYGLSDDEATLQFSLRQDKSADSLKLYFGRLVSGQGDLLYAAFRGTGQVFAVQKSQVENLGMSLSELRDSRLYFLSPAAIVWIRIEEGEKALQLQKDPAGFWQVTAPEQCKADTRRVEDLINRLNTLRIESFLSGTNLAELGLSPPERVIRMATLPLVSANATQNVAAAAVSAKPGAAVAPNGRTLLLSRPMSGREYVHARFEEETEIYQISVAAAATVALDPLAYRDLVALELDPAAITAIVLRKKDVEHSVVREGTGPWRAAASPGAQVNLAAITALLEQITALRVLRFERSELRDLGVYGLKDPRGKLTFSLSGQSGLQKTLLLGETSEDRGVYGMVQGQDSVFVLPKALAEELLQDLTR